LLAHDRLEHVARLRDIRQINLGLDLIGLDATGTGLLVRLLGIACTAEVATHFFRFEIFNGARMSLLLGDADRSKRFENSFALDF
jgi:hypothetical protein